MRSYSSYRSPIPDRYEVDVGGFKIDISDELRTPIYTFGMIKPHAYHKKHQILHAIEELSQKKHRGRRSSHPLWVIHGRDYQMSEDIAKMHYAEHAGKPFFEGLVRMICDGPISAFILSGTDAIIEFRDITGNTQKPAPHTIRGIFGEPERGVAYNAVHASDSLESFVREVGVHFTPEEIEDLGEHFWKRLDAYKQWCDSLGRRK